jgi:hypothetical protein
MRIILYFVIPLFPREQGKPVEICLDDRNINVTFHGLSILTLSAGSKHQTGRHSQEAGEIGNLSLQSLLYLDGKLVK